MNLPTYPSIRQLAKFAGISKDALWRRVRVLHAKHGDLLVDVGMKHPRVSLSRYVQLCSDVLGSPIATASEVDFLEQRVQRCEKKLGIPLPF